MDDNFYRVESAVSASASGNLTWERWSLDAITALGLSGHRNPLGFALVRYLNDQNSTAVWGVVLALATVLMKRDSALTSKVANERAFRAFEFWNDMHCRRCTGRGITGIEQTNCPVCGGSGDRPISEADDSAKDGVSRLIEAQQWMEGQLAARLRDAKYQMPPEGYRLNLNQANGNQVEVLGNPVTTRAPGHD